MDTSRKLGTQSPPVQAPAQPTAPGTVIGRSVQGLSRRRTRAGTSFRLRRNDRPGGTRAARLVADAAHHRSPYFAGGFRAGGNFPSSCHFTRCAYSTNPIQFCCRSPHSGNRVIIHHTDRDCKFFHKDFPGNFQMPAPICFIRPRRMSPALARSSAVKA